jgi:hypothetical protein
VQCIALMEGHAGDKGGCRSSEPLLPPHFQGGMAIQHARSRLADLGLHV